MERLHKERVDVSPEMVTFVGTGAVETAGWPEAALVFAFDLDGATFCRLPPARIDGAEEATLVLAVAAEACRRLFPAVTDAGGCWHMPSEVRALALAIVGCTAPEPARATLRLARSIELLCATFAHFEAGTLVAADPAGALTEAEAAQVVAARRMIDERWAEKLTLDAIARAVGLNRAKLTRGFRLMYDTSIAVALAENRLGRARSMLLATDLPVSAVGYRCGYLNNAAFTRAFSRRFGLPPTQLRQGSLAA